MLFSQINSLLVVVIVFLNLFLVPGTNSYFEYQVARPLMYSSFSHTHCLFEFTHSWLTVAKEEIPQHWCEEKVFFCC